MRSVAPVLLLAILVVSAGCLTDGGDGDDEDLPHVGTTEGFLFPDLELTSVLATSTHRENLRSLMGELTFLMVATPVLDPAFIVQHVHFGPVRDHFTNVTEEVLVVFTDPATPEEVAREYSGRWTDEAYIPGEDLNTTLSLVRPITVFTLDADGVIIARNDGQVGQAQMIRQVEDHWGVPPPADVGPEVGQLAPDLLWVSVDGEVGQLDNWLEDPVLLNVWEYECPFCLELFNELVKVHANYSGEGLRMVSIDLITWETEDQVRSVMASYGAQWEFAIDSDTIQSRYDLWRLPALFLIDGDGVIRWTWTGYVASSIISDEVEKLI